MLYNQIQEAQHFIEKKIKFQAKVGIILGTGLGNLIDHLEVEEELPYAQIPHFPVSTVDSHSGKLVFGQLNGTPVIVMAGRFHYYEGYSAKQITFPIRVLQFLGIERIFISNVSGGINPEYEQGDLIFIQDHINLQPDNPLRGPNDERLGPRFPDLSDCYDQEVIAFAEQEAAEHNIRHHRGVYVCLQGPNLETPAEYTYMHRIGGDVVGMSTVPEVLVAKHQGLSVFVVSVVSNVCYPPERISPTTIESVIALGKEVEPKMTKIITALTSRFGKV